MTTIRVSLVDVYVLRVHGTAQMEMLILRRAPNGRCPGAWETVHGHIDADEGPVAAAVRELDEETGLAPERFYNLSRVDAFYRHGLDEVSLIPVFGAVVSNDAAVTLSEEHDDFEWVIPDEAVARFAWPRERRAVSDVVHLLGDGCAGPVEDVLAIDQRSWMI